MAHILARATSSLISAAAAPSVSAKPLGGHHGDPYLKFQPHFAFSLPVQILCNGIILTLATVLLIHLTLTAQYHWALARLNYGLQLSAVITLCISLVATTMVIFSSVHSDSRNWPYMLDYIAVDVPKEEWNLTEQILWYTLEALTSGLAHITHIQFLTLMYPSKLEARLIFILIGPLAIASSAMQFCSLSPHKRAQDLGDAIRGVCNTTLALLFSAALFIWGFVVNRKRAWRTDGGTAAFGAAAIVLAIVSVAINFVLIFVDELTWLPALSWAVVLWQTFLGWWWWVGAGMSIGEVEDMLSREQKRKDDRRRKKIKQLQKQDRLHGHGNSSSRHTTSAGGEFGTASGSSRASRWVDTIVPGSLTRRRHARQTTAGGTRPGTPTGMGPDVVIVVTSPSEAEDAETSSPRHRRRPSPPHSSNSPPEEIELSPMGGARDRDRDDDLEESISDAGSGSTGVNTPIVIPSTVQKIPFAPSLYTSIVLAWRTLTRAHRTAARAEVINAAGGVVALGGSGLSDDGAGGWGLGNFGLREREEAERRIRDFQEERRRRMLVPNAADTGIGGASGEHSDDEEDEFEDEDDDEDVDRRRTQRRRSRRGRRVGSYPPTAPPPARTRQSLDHRESEASLPHPLPPSDSLFWRWGPLRRWRLQDRTSY